MLRRASFESIVEKMMVTNIFSFTDKIFTPLYPPLNCSLYDYGLRLDRWTPILCSDDKAQYNLGPYSPTILKNILCLILQIFFFFFFFFI